MINQKRSVAQVSAGKQALAQPNLSDSFFSSIGLYITERFAIFES